MVDAWDAVSQGWSRKGIEMWANQSRVMAYRGALAADASADLLAQWRWDLGLWTPEDRSKFSEFVHAAYEKFHAGQQ